MKYTKFFLSLLLAVCAAGCGGSANIILLTPAPTDTLSNTPTPPPVPTGFSDTTVPTYTPSTATSPAATATPHPALATNGPYLAYQRPEGDQNSVVLLDADGKGQKRFSYPPNAAPENESLSLSKALSPDGKWLAYYTGSAGQCFGNTGADTADLTLNLMSLSDGKTQVVTKLLSQDYPNIFDKAAQELSQPDVNAEMLQNAFICGITQSLAWSPDGRSLAFAGQMDGLSSDLYLYDLASGKSKRLSSGSQEVQWISWSPDGKWILDGSSYSVGEGMKYTVYATSVDGTSVKLLPNGGPVSWLNDQIYFSSKGDNGPGSYDLTLFNIVTGKTAEIWNGSFGPFAVIPGGNWVALFANTPVWPYSYTSDFVRGPFLVNLTSLKQTRVNFPSNPDVTFVNVQAFNSAGDRAFLLKSFGNNQSLYYLSTDGMLTPTGVQADTYSVSPDGQHWVAANTSLQIFSADGIALRTVDLPADLTGQGIQSFIWRPDSSGLFFYYDDLRDANFVPGLYTVDLMKGDIEQVDSFPVPMLTDFVWVGGAK